MQNSQKLDKDILALHKTEQFPQEEFIDQTDAFPGEEVANQPAASAAQPSSEEKISDHLAEQQPSPNDHPESNEKTDRQTLISTGEQSND